MSPHEMIFLSDVTGDDRIFSIKDVPPFSLGEVLSISERSDEFFLEIRSNNGYYEVAAFGRHKFAIYEPEAIAAKNLCVGDSVLLRGRRSLPDSLSANELPMSCVSEVLEISQNHKSELEVLFRLSRPITPKLHFGPIELPFNGRPTTDVLMTLTPDARIEISHGGYA